MCSVLYNVIQHHKHYSNIDLCRRQCKMAENFTGRNTSNQPDVQVQYAVFLDNGPIANGIFTFLLILETLVVMIFNIGTVVVLLRSKQLRKHVTNILIAYLSVADFFVGPPVLYLMLADSIQFPVNARAHGFFVNLLAILSLRLSLATLTLITADRLVAVWRPLSYSKLITKNRAHVIVAITWVYIILVNGVPLLIGVLEREPTVVLTGQPRDFLPPAIYLGILMPHVYVPILLNTVMYGIIFRILAKQASKVASSGSANSEERRRLQNRRIAKMMMLILVGLVASLCPFSVLIQLYRPTDPMAPKWWTASLTLSIVLLYTNSWINPVIYRWLSPEWRRSYLVVMMCDRWSVDKSRSEGPQTISTQLPDVNQWQATHYQSWDSFFLASFCYLVQKMLDKQYWWPLSTIKHLHLSMSIYI